MGTVLSLILAYILGSISFGLIIARQQKGIDIRDYGSGNIGATNVFRVIGKKAGILTLLGDSLKGTVAVILARVLSGTAMGAGMAGLAVIVGHMFPLFAGFRGGKGVATALGVFIVLTPGATLLAALIWGLCCFLWRYVSLASMTAALSLPVWILLLEGEGPYLPVAIVIAILIIWKHQDNIARLWQGTESKIGSKLGP